MRGGYAMIQVSNTPGGFIAGYAPGAYKILCAAITSTYKPVYVAPFMMGDLVFGGCFVTPFKSGDSSNPSVSFNVFGTPINPSGVQTAVTGLTVTVDYRNSVSSNRIQT